MVIKHKALRFLLSGSLLWMILFPLVFVCGMAQPVSEDENVTTCCPSQLSQPIESSSENQPQYQICHITKSGDSHNCTFCPCEYKSGLMQIKLSATITVSPTDLISALRTEEIELFDNQANNSNITYHKFDVQSYSGPALFVRNCTWLI